MMLFLNWLIKSLSRYVSTKMRKMRRRRRRYKFCLVSNFSLLLLLVIILLFTLWINEGKKNLHFKYSTSKSFSIPLSGRKISLSALWESQWIEKIISNWEKKERVNIIIAVTRFLSCTYYIWWYVLHVDHD